MRLVSEAAKAAERAAKEAEAKAKKEAEEANVSYFPLPLAALSISFKPELMFAFWISMAFR